MSLKIGIVGAGGMARYHIQGFRAAGAEVVAIADSNAAAAKAAAERLDVDTTFDSLGAMLASGSVDAVSLCPGRVRSSCVAS